MGISEGWEGGEGIDCSVGTIVWVRRRNGSWWPGRILGSDELSASHLLSPRSGTPVKLLGREDASVDWYNLEKSKRVKAFRCGEFDDCIRRAESSQGIPPKKREKYARREDAIIHALELENQQYEKKRQKLGIGSNYWINKMLGTSNRDLGSCSPAEDFSGNDKGRDHCRYINKKPHTLSKKPDSSLEEESMCNLLYVQKGKHPKPSWEGDNSEASPRMRGLQDFGLRTATSRQKLSASIASRRSRKPFLADESCVLPTVGRNIGTLNYVCCNKNFMSIKNKRSLGGVAEESLIRRRDRCRPLVQVLQNSAQSPVCQSLQSNGDTMSITMQGEKEQVGALYQAKRGKGVYQSIESNDFLDHKRFPLEQMRTSPPHFGMDNSLLHPGSLTEEDMSSGLIEAQESDSSAGDYLDHDIEEDEALFSDPANSGRYFSHGGSVYQVPMQAGNMDNEELDESELSSYVSQLQPHEQTAGIASDMGGSKWQLKGKRNIRNLTKRPMELIDGKDPVEILDKCNVSIHQALCRDEGDIIKTTRINSRRALGRQGLHYRGEEFSYTYEEGGPIENDLMQTQMVGFVRRCPSMLKASSGDRGRSNNSFISSDEDSRVISPSIWVADLQSQEALRGYWEESDGCFDPVYVGHLGDQMEPMLLDVDLKVQASYQGEHVPLVSLMSKLNGKAIVGHPVQIEILEDGYSDFLLPSDGFCERLPDTDGNTALLQVWRTARRTAMHRAPRPPSSAMEGEEASTLQYSDLERKRPFKKRYAGYVKHKVRSMKGRISRTRGHRARKKKQLKKASLSSQKTRTLSSIAIEQKPARKNSITKLADKNNELHRLIKPETPPMVTFVPVKLVFSRIREAIGRPPLAAPSHRVLIADSAEWKLPS